MAYYGKPFWKTAPFLRILPALTAGILVQFYMGIPVIATGITSITFILVPIGTRFLSIAGKFKARWVNGIAIQVVLFCAGAFLLYFRNIEHRPDWIGNHYHENEIIWVTLQESPVEKNKTYKTLATAKAVGLNGKWWPVSGNLLLYFSKDALINLPGYGSQLLVQKKLQPISNSGNPGTFDYKQYCAFQDIHYQVFLRQGDYEILPVQNRSGFATALIHSRNTLLSTLKKNITGDNETGVAEALLIGYKNDLDKDLLRSYSNTGVVHIIAISGLHLGMIYGLLLLLFRPFRNHSWARWFKPLFILAVLWWFSFLAGAVPSILRSAVMFSFIIIGEAFNKKSNINNTLAASAFCLLAYNPYYLWDVGFQLSYAAVIGIVLFMKPIHKWFHFKNKLLNLVWQLNAVTLSAQVLTLPLVLYYFHQFPNLFLFTNFIVVPLSGFILYGCLLLLLVAKIPILGTLTGKGVSYLITQMNGLIQRTASIPYAVTSQIQINLLQTFLLYGCIACLAWWLFQKKPRGV